LVALLLTAGCSSPAARPPGPAPSHSEAAVEFTITVYEDPAFTRPVGKVGHFAVECADYKDPDEQSLQPPFVERYKVREDPPLHTPPLEGYVDPNQQRLLITGTAPSCAAPPSDH
jgi:hypothetical protein